MLFRKSSNLFLSFSLICEVYNVHCKCFLKLFFQVLKIVWSPIREGLVIFHLITYFPYFPLFVLLYVFTFLVPCCDVQYDFCIYTMFHSSLPSVVCRRAHVLFTLICVCGRMMVSITHLKYMCNMTGVL